MKTKYLSRQERERGLRLFLKATFFNGLAFTFLGDTTVILMAIHFGASNTQLGYLASAPFICGLTILIVPAVFGNANLLNVFLGCWFGRGIVCILYGMTLVLTENRAVLAVMTIYTIYCICRAVGVALTNPLQQSLSTPSTVGEVIAGVTIRAGSGIVVARIFSALVLTTATFSGIYGLLLLQMVGVIANTTSVMLLRALPCRDTVERGRGRSIFHILRDQMRDRERAIVLLLEWGKIPLAVLYGFVIPFLKREVGFSDSMVFVFTILTAVAFVASGHVIKLCSDRLGSKPLLVVGHIILAGLSLTWALLTPTLPLGILLGLGFATAFSLALVVALVARLIIKNIPDGEKVGYVSMYSFVDAAVALGAGVVGGYLADMTLPSESTLHSYSYPFLTMAIFALLNGLICTRLTDPGSSSVRETLAILSSTRNLRSFIDIALLDTVTDWTKRESILLSLETSDTPLATEEIRQRLHNPAPWEKERLYKALFLHPRPELLALIIDEATDLEAYNREHAVFALGRYPGPRTEAALRQCFESPNPVIRSVAAKSLARIGSRQELPTIRSLLVTTEAPICQFNLIVALTIMDDHGTYLADLFDIATTQKGERFNQAMFSVCAQSLDMNPPLREFFFQENLAANAGFAALLDEFRENARFLESARSLCTWYECGHHLAIWRWCQTLLADCDDITAPYTYLRGAILAQDGQGANGTTSLAALYFTYQIHTCSTAIYSTSDGVKL